MKRLICLCCMLLFLLSGCGSQTVQAENWGSFTAEKAYSCDGAFYAVQSTEEQNSIEYAVVSIYATENNERLFSFAPARASDFWGVCWEQDTYDLWIQSGDIGVLCYQYNDSRWSMVQSKIRPDNIVSKYD